jgi:ribosomal protein S8
MSSKSSTILLALKNALLRKKIWAEISFSPTSFRFLLTLRNIGFIRGFEKVSGKKKKALKVYLKYDINFLPVVAQARTVATIEKKVSLKKNQTVSNKAGFHFYFFSRFPKIKNVKLQGDFLYVLS